ncbi:MAG: hypothetical protein U0168_12720 [Nannocystaceae bacterium]
MLTTILLSALAMNNTAAAASSVHARIDFTALRVINTTGDEPASDEPYVKYFSTVARHGSPTAIPARTPGKLPTTSEHYSTDAGDFSFHSAKTLWEGNLEDGDAVLVVATVMEDDLQPPDWKRWVADGGGCALTGATILLGIADVPAIGGCGSLAWDIVKAIDGDDYVGQVSIVVKNVGGVLKKSIHAGKQTKIGGHGSYDALSESGKTIRFLCDGGGDELYHASFQVRDLNDGTADGAAMVWTKVDSKNGK